MFLSIIIPVYNAEKYIGVCLDSLLNQDISDYEILCINDGSTDGSLAVLEHYAAMHSNIRIISKENGGVTTARNTGLENARGDFIWFVDADDFVKENVLGRFQELIQQNNCDRLIIGCYIFDDILTPEEQERSRCGQLPLNGPGPDSIVVRSIFRRDFLKKHNLYFSHPELTHGEDGLFMYEFCVHNPTAVELDEAIYFYRIHSGSADTTDSVAGLQKKFRSFYRIVVILKEYYHNGCQDSRTANAYMTFLWFSLLTAASMPGKESRNALVQLKQGGLFPGKRLPECDLTQSYMTDKTGFVGNLYDTLYLNLHTRWGYAGMRIIRQLLRWKHRLCK